MRVQQALRRRPDQDSCKSRLQVHTFDCGLICKAGTNVPLTVIIKAFPCLCVGLGR